MYIYLLYLSISYIYIYIYCISAASFYSNSCSINRFSWAKWLNLQIEATTNQTESQEIKSNETQQKEILLKPRIKLNPNIGT